jgi:linoleoyl-CoA desaturase
MKGSVKFVSTKENKDFFEVLKKRVDNYFVSNHISKNANAKMVIKTIILLSGYILPFVILLTWHPLFNIQLLLWTIMGFSVAGIGMSVMHDANHGSYSSNKTVNYLLGHTLNLLGGSVFNWKLQHNILHHTYTNIVGLDDDIQDRLVLKFSPHTKTKFFHQFQKYYAFLFYGILTLYWTVAKDFIQFYQFTRDGVNPNSSRENWITFFQIFLVKVGYFFVVFFVPIYFLDFTFLQIFGGYLLMHFWAGLVLTTVFQLAHTVDGTSHPLPNENGVIENNWAIHQLNTTINFSRKNKWISWYVGGLNFQVEHHLFPKVCHVHYPNIAPIVKETAEEYGIPYLENETFADAIKAHLAALQKFGSLPNINTAIS